MRKYKGAGIALFKKQNNDYAILLGKRTIKPNKGKWSIPGGRFEKSDNFFFETAIREFREETGINLFDIVIEKKLLSVDLIILFLNGKLLCLKLILIFMYLKHFAMSFLK